VSRSYPKGNILFIGDPCFGGMIISGASAPVADDDGWSSRSRSARRCRGSHPTLDGGLHNDGDPLSARVAIVPRNLSRGLPRCCCTIVAALEVLLRVSTSAAGVVTRQAPRTRRADRSRAEPGVLDDGHEYRRAATDPSELPANLDRSSSRV
jgi:hypothetical protein